MLRTFTHDSVDINYELKKSKRAKRIRIAIARGQKVTVTVPRWVLLSAGEAFLRSNADWVTKTLTRKQAFGHSMPIIDDWKAYKETAMDIVNFIIAKYQHIYPYKFRGIAIKNQSGRWGSCSSKGNLNFNYRIQFLPMELAEYLVVHELCHLKQMNHSSKFWLLVSKSFPNYQELRKQLRAIHY